MKQLSFRRLRKEGLEACKSRGHTPRLQFSEKEEGNYRTVAYWQCKKCNMGMNINTRPAPNEIEIGGRMVALNCGDTL